MANFLLRLLGLAPRPAEVPVAGRSEARDPTSADATLRQAVRDMRAQLNEVVQASAEALTAQNRLETEVRHLRTEAEQWRGRAREALASGDEDRARQALARKQECERKLEALEPSLESARRTAATLDAEVSRLRRRIEDAERDVSALIARRDAAAAKNRIAWTIDGVGDPGSAQAALEALEESAARAEAEAEVHGLTSAPDDVVERSFRALERPDVASELEELRREVNSRIPPASTGDEG